MKSSNDGSPGVRRYTRPHPARRGARRRGPAGGKEAPDSGDPRHRHQRADRSPLQATFLQALRDLGWVEGRNLLVERRVAEAPDERLAQAAAELVRLKPDVIFAASGPASLNAAREATKTIPIVMVASSRDPIGTGLVQSYARPGGNITGLVTAPEELTGKQLELLKTVVPHLSRAGFLHDATVGPFRLEKATVETSRALGVEVLPFEVRAPADFGGAVAAAVKERVGGLVFAGSPMFVRYRQQIAELLTKHRLPGISVWRSFAEAGVLMAYGPSLSDQFHRAAAYVDKILKGAKPADLPVEQPTKFELVINLKTAKALGLTIPPSLLLRADQVIE
jgi:putative tryptophan/tyrosine transport system substrate-binding protein